MTQTHLPIAVIGAGPIGLAAAAHLVSRGETPIVLEAGGEIAASVRNWGHVQLFSPWRYVIDHVAAQFLAETDWTQPDPEGYPTGHSLIDRYLAPLAALPQLQHHIHLNTRVVAVARRGFDKLKTTGRDQAPFVLRVVNSTGEEREIVARAVIDASGTYRAPNPLGANGLLALGERAAQAHIVYGIPDVLGKERERYAGRRVAVIGSGHSAFNAVLDLALLAEQVPGTAVTWAVRRSSMGQAYGGGLSDALPARGELGLRVQSLVERGIIQLVTGWQVEHIEQTPDGLTLMAGEKRLAPVDEVVVATGFRPDLDMLRELRLGLDATVEAPNALAPLIDPNVHSCGTVPPHGVNELSHPEPNFFIVGMKSYGRAPTFLMLTGYEQVRSVVAGLVGDWEAARHIELVLPETGVCSGPIAAGGGLGAASCCSAPVSTSPQTIALAPVKERGIPLTLIPVSQTLAIQSACCSVEAQGNCCEPEQKNDCCGTTALVETSSCGCQNA